VTNPLVQKLSHANDLTNEDRALLRRISDRPRAVAARTDLIREGDAPSTIRLVLRGLAYRYKDLPNGERAIVALLIPGDFCDLHVTILGQMDHSIATLSACDIVEIPQAAIQHLTATNPRITRALWWATLVDEAVLRQWLVGRGRRNADQQLLHLFCELLVRFQTVGLAKGDSYPLPITQMDLSDILGLSTVHTNRTLQGLRAEGLITFEDGCVTLLNRERAWKLIQFDPNYLHLKRRE